LTDGIHLILNELSLFIMKRAIAIVFLSAYLLSSTELHELFRLPLFVEHFIVHNQQQDISLKDFIVLHYFSGDIRDADYADDMKLPFKGHWDLSSFRSLCFIIPFTTVRQSGALAFSVEYNHYIHSFMPSAQIENIWQPPRA
jgi:hypothetical protein